MLSPATAPTLTPLLSVYDWQVLLIVFTLNALQAGVKTLSLENALKVYEVATPDERAQLKDIMDSKFHLIADGPPADEARLTARYNKVMALPIAR